MNKQLTLTLTIEEANLIRDALVEMPFKKVIGFIQNMDKQVQEQLKETESVQH